MASIYKISTPIIAMNSFEFSNATITIPKEEYIDLVLYCANWNFIDKFCSRWDDYITNIQQNETYVTFTINKFSAYAGVSKVSKVQNLSEITIKIIDSKKTVLQEIKINKTDFSVGIFDEKKQGKNKKSIKEFTAEDQSPIKINFKDISENISIQIDIPDEELIAKGIKTEIISILPDNNISISESQIILEKISGLGSLNRIFYCSSWNQDTFKCNNQWQPTSISFVENSTHITFNVTHFTAYAGGYLEESDTTNLMIWDDSDDNIIIINQTNKFYANYSNLTSELPISGNGIYCEFSENSSESWSNLVNMTFNSSSGFYEYTKTFENIGDYSFNISCYNNLGYNDLSAIDNFLISYACVGENYNFVCGDTLIESCTLNGNLSAVGNCFTSSANNLIINGNGYFINGDGTGNGIYIGYHSNATVKNFNIINFTKGIYTQESTDSLVDNNNVSDTSEEGILIYGVATNTIVSNNTILNPRVLPATRGSPRTAASFPASARVTAASPAKPVTTARTRSGRTRSTRTTTTSRPGNCKGTRARWPSARRAMHRVRSHLR